MAVLIATIAGLAVVSVLTVGWWKVLRIVQEPSWPPGPDAVSAANAQAATETFVTRGGHGPHDGGIEYAWSTAATIEPWSEGRNFYPRIFADVENACSSVRAGHRLLEAGHPVLRPRSKIRPLARGQALLLPVRWIMFEGARMRTQTVKLALSAILCLSLANGQVEAEAWKTFTSKEGGFRILMPGTPTLTRATHKSFVGAVHEYTYSIDTRNGYYSANYSVLPGIAVNLGGATTILDKAKKGFLEDVGGKEIRLHDTSIRGHPGKELSFQIASSGGSKGKSGRARFYLVNKILYVLVGTSSTPDDPDIARFLDSFRIVSS